jgi:hypothetical protein
MKQASSDADRRLLFDWQGDDRSLLRMGLSLLTTLVGLCGLFVVFRVVAPVPSARDVRPQYVLVLNPAVPAERALIHQAMDRSFPILPADVGAAAPVPVPRPRLSPVYARQELRLKPLPGDLAEVMPSRPAATGMNLLPPPAAAREPALAEPPPQRLHAVFEGPLAARAPGPTFFEGVPLAEITRPRFHLAVDAGGRVLHVLPLIASEDASLTALLTDRLRGLRFKPAPGDEVTAGVVSFAWKEAAP